jgi:hypothetical protein
MARELYRMSKELPLSQPEAVSTEVPAAGYTPVVRDHRYMTSALDYLLGVWMKNRYLRLGQLISNAAYPADIFNIEDKELVNRLVTYNERFPGLASD